MRSAVLVAWIIARQALPRAQIHEPSHSFRSFYKPAFWTDHYRESRSEAALKAATQPKSRFEAAFKVATQPKSRFEAGFKVARQSKSRFEAAFG
jgi:hypothetical protein